LIVVFVDKGQRRLQLVIMEVDKMQVPGWRIEKRFNNKVLIGNWSEERRKFQKLSNPFGNSTHRNDFNKYSHGSYLPDMKIRREAEMLNEGLPKKFVFSHHGDSYSNNLISWYDQQMNQRELCESTLPKLRQWDGKSTSFKPENTDHPLQGNPTNYGLREKMKTKWLKEAQNDAINNFGSTYQQSYYSHPQNALVVKHFASPKLLSSHFNTHNRVNKHLPFRNSFVNIAPEFTPVASI